MRKFLLLGGLFSTLSFSLQNTDISFLQNLVKTSHINNTKDSNDKGTLKIGKPTAKKYKYLIVGTLSLGKLINILANIKGYSVIFDNDVLRDENKVFKWNIRTNDFDNVLKAIEKEANIWIIENPLSKTIEVKKYRWITIETDLEGTTNFSLSAGGVSTPSQSGENQSGQNQGGESQSSTGFAYTIKNQDAKLLLGILSSLSIPSYPFSAGFIKMKVSPTQYEAVKTIFATLKKYSEVILGKVEILKVDLNDRNRWGINWSAFFKGFTAGQIKEVSLSVGLTPFSTSENPVQIALLDKNGNTDALIQFLKQYGNVKAVNTWIFEGKTGTIIPFGSYKEEPYLTYQVVQGQTTTQVVPQIQYKYAGFMGNIYVAKQKNRYFVELALSLSDIYGYFTLTTQEFTEQIPKLQANQMKISTYIPHLNTTLLLTGFKLKSIQNTEEKVPFLGDIPLIGNLFKSADKQVVNSEFVILITLYKFSRNYYLKANYEEMRKNIINTKRELDKITKPQNKEKKPYKVIISF